MLEAQRRLNALLPQGVRGAVVRAEDRQRRILFECAAGHLRSDHRKVMAPDDRFHVASVTKTMTATVLLQLLEDELPGALDASLTELDLLPQSALDRIARRGGESFGHLITLRHLLTHTSGMLDAFTDGEPAISGLQRLDSYILDVPEHRTKAWRPWDAKREGDRDAGVLNYYLNSGHSERHLGPPGSAFHYSDTGYVVLALAVERLAGKRFDEVLDSQLFKPLGMTATYLAYASDPADLEDRRYPEADVWLGDAGLLSSGCSLSSDWGGGGVVSTAPDLARFLRALLEGSLFRSRDTIELMTSWLRPPGLSAPRTGVGLGIQRFAANGREVWGHTGSWGARMLIEPRSGVILTGSINRAEGPWNWHESFLDLALELAERNTETSK